MAALSNMGQGRSALQQLSSDNLELAFPIPMAQEVNQSMYSEVPNKHPWTALNFWKKIHHGQPY